MNAKQDIKLIYAATLLCLILLAFAFYQSKGIEGGLDSWNHFLISRSALKHPELLLDQWNKPVFTWCTVLICQFGFNALIVFNILCVCTSALLNAFAIKKIGYNNTWIVVPFSVFVPILFQNTISGLTEPLNILFLSLVFYFWSKDYLKTAVSMASFLPFVRTEGFVICGAVFLLILYRKEYRLLFWLVLGSIVMNLIGWGLTGKPFWIISENPYWKHETEGTFDPGSGSLLHFFNNRNSLFGKPLVWMFFASNLILGYRMFTKKKIHDLWMLSFLVFWLYFLAHTFIYYFGILGSHGLTRVMAVLSPPLAILAFYTLDSFTVRFKPILKKILYFCVSIMVIWTAYKETGYAKPYRLSNPTVKYDKSQQNFIKAGLWLKENGYMDRTIIHQSPYFDVIFNKDPYDIRSSYRVWSIDQKNDWAEKGVIVIWDGFSAVREGNMKLEWLKNNPKYQILHQIKGFEMPASDSTQYDVVLFEKIAP